MTTPSDTPQPACYATFLNGKIEYSELCVADNPGDFDVSDYEDGIEIVALYSEDTIAALERQLTQCRAELAEATEECKALSSLLTALDEKLATVEAEARNEALEEAAKVAEKRGEPFAMHPQDGAMMFCAKTKQIAAEIRAMKGTP